MLSFSQWLKEHMGQGSMADNEVPELDARHRGALPYYAPEELPPTPKNKPKIKKPIKFAKF